MVGIVKTFVVVQEGDLPPSGEYPVAECAVSGLRQARMVHPEGYSLRLCQAELEPGAQMQFGADHGDEGIYVASGGLRVGDRDCPAGGAVVVESGVAATVEAPDGATVLHASPVDHAPPAGGLNGAAKAEGHCVHVVGPAGWFNSGAKEQVSAVWFTDSTCPTCRIAFFTVSRLPGEAKPGIPHSHSQDEIIFVLSGSVALGARVYGPGSGICIPAGARYALGWTDQPATFLNYRRDAAEQTYYEKGGIAKVEPEGGLSRGGSEVGDVVNVGV